MTKKLSRGDKFRAEVTATHEFSAIETLLLEELCDTLDILDCRDELSLAEVRQQKIVLSRLAGQLNLDTGTPALSMSGPSVRGRRAAAIRWERVRQEKGA